MPAALTILGQKFMGVLAGTFGLLLATPRICCGPYVLLPKTALASGSRFWDQQYRPEPDLKRRPIHQRGRMGWGSMATGMS
jgi:hypothetical protein